MEMEHNEPAKVRKAVEEENLEASRPRRRASRGIEEEPNPIGVCDDQAILHRRKGEVGVAVLNEQVARSPRAIIYGKVKAAVMKGAGLGYTVVETAEAFSVSKRSVRSVADRLKVKLKPIRKRSR